MKIQFSLILIIIAMLSFSACNKGDKSDSKDMKPMEKPAEKPAEAMEKPAEKPAEAMEKPAEKPAEAMEKPAEKPAEAMEKPAETVAASKGNDKKGKKVFKKNGCAACHFKDKGENLKPYPSKQAMGSLSFADFKKIVTEGRAGTMMKAFKLSDEELENLYAYLGTYK